MALPANVEIKARVTDRGRLETALRELSGADPVVLEQTDTFFPVGHGRLKLRQENGRAGLIAYRRADAAGPRISTYAVTPVPEPGILAAMLADALGGRQVVRKVRHLYHVGNSRVHLDRVEGLGDYLEIETEVERAGSDAAADAEARALIAALGVRPENLEARAYTDLLREAGSHEG